jgi:hypothetical protein
MKYSERFFKIPIKTYKGSDWKKVEKAYEQLSEGIDVDLEEPNNAKGYEYIDPSEIIRVSPSFSIFASIEDVKEFGFKLSTIYFRNGDSSVCLWSAEKVLSKLDEFVDALEQKELQDRDTVIAKLQETLGDKFKIIEDDGTIN